MLPILPGCSSFLQLTTFVGKAAFSTFSTPWESAGAPQMERTAQKKKQKISSTLHSAWRLLEGAELSRLEQELRDAWAEASWDAQTLQDHETILRLRDPRSTLLLLKDNYAEGGDKTRGWLNVNLRRYALSYLICAGGYIPLNTAAVKDMLGTWSFSPEDAREEAMILHGVACFFSSFNHSRGIFHGRFLSNAAIDNYHVRPHPRASRGQRTKPVAPGLVSQ